MLQANVFFLGAKLNLKYLVLYSGTDGLKTNQAGKQCREEEKDAVKI